MLYKYLFYFITFCLKKTGISSDGEFWLWLGATWASAIIGLTIALNLHEALECIGIVWLPNFGKFLVRTRVMVYFDTSAAVLSFFYFSAGDRWTCVYEEIRQRPKDEKIRYFVLCLVYVVFTYGLFFLCSDVIRELNTQCGAEFAERIVEILNLTYW